jgi:hypothetical protein
MRSAVHLRVVRDEPEGDRGAPQGAGATPAVADRGDLLLITVLFLLNVVPVAGELAGVGRWSSAVVGFAAGALLLTGRELWSQLRARARARKETTGAP